MGAGGYGDASVRLAEGRREIRKDLKGRKEKTNKRTNKREAYFQRAWTELGPEYRGTKSEVYVCIDGLSNVVKA